MVEQAAKDYSKYFKCCNIEKELNPIYSSIDEMLERLDEFETLISNVKSETNSIMMEHINATIGYQENFKLLQKRIDKLDEFIEIVDENVKKVEKSVDIAETELNINDYSLKGLLFKPFAKQTIFNETNSNLVDGEYKNVEIFKTSEYFDISNEEFEDVTVGLEADDNNMMIEKDKNVTKT